MLQKHVTLAILVTHVLHLLAIHVTLAIHATHATRVLRIRATRVLLATHGLAILAAHATHATLARLRAKTVPTAGMAFCLPVVYPQDPLLPDQLPAGHVW